MHRREVCRHGTLVRTCRCIDSAKHTVIVECPERCPYKGKPAAGTEGADT